MHRLIPILVTASLVPAAALAQEVVGTISGVIDGVPASWSIQDGADFATDWTDTDGGIEVTIAAYPEATPPTEDERLLITFTADGTARQPVAEDAVVEYATGGETLQASGQNADFSLTNMEIEGDSLVVAGNLVVTAVEGGSDELLIATGRGTTIDGNFQATIMRGE